MKLLVYTINGEKIGIDIPTWNVEMLSGNNAFLATGHDDPIPSGYTDISSIVNWNLFGGSAFCAKTGVHLELTDMFIREEIKEYLTDAQLTGSTSGLTAQEIEIVQTHKLDKYYSIYNYFNKIPYDVNVQNPPVDVDYNLLGMHKKRHFNKGELYKVEYYGEYDFLTDSYDKLIVHEDREFYRINEMIYRRETHICWHYNTMVSGATKQGTKYYTQQESMANGERRRRNCITNLKIGAVGLIMMASGLTQQDAELVGWSFLDEFNQQIAVYIEGAETQLKTDLLSTTNHDWLDFVIPNAGGLTVRYYLYDGINIDYTENNTYM